MMKDKYFYLVFHFSERQDKLDVSVPEEINILYVSFVLAL